VHDAVTQTLAVQVAGDVHVPQLTERAAPQLSVPANELQFLPCRLQNTASVSGAQPQTFGPPPPHVAGAVQLGQVTEARSAPQLSTTLVRVPQFLPSRVQSAVSPSGLQVHALAEQTLGAVHVPQLTVRPTLQLSFAVTLSQVLPSRAQNAASVSLAQPQTFGVPPPPHVPEAQVPQLTDRPTPQLSVPVTVPHLPLQNAVSPW
jgi:hypothetical protein